jgi:hypothetical protein
MLNKRRTKWMEQNSDTVENKLKTFRELAERFSLIRLTGKRPIEKGWELYCGRKRSFEEIGFQLNDNAGVACGPASKVIVLDVDDVKEFKNVCEERGWSIPLTFTVLTGKKRPHLYFEYPNNGKTYGNKAFKKLGFDIRGDGGQVVAPGSIHPDTRQPYTLHKDVEIAPAPQWLLDLYEEPVRQSSTEIAVEDTHWDGNLETLPVSTKIRQLIREGKPKGQRSEAAMSVLNALVAKGISDDQICQIFELYPIGEKAREKNDQYKWLHNEIEKARKYVAANPLPKSQDGKPEINAERRDVENVSKLVWEALISKNNPPWLFRHPVGVVSLEKSEDGAISFKRLSTARMGHILARKFSWFKVEKESKVPALPPNWVIKDMLAEPKPPLPYLSRIMKHPVFSEDGSLAVDRGYSAKTKCYYSAPSELEIPKVADAPSLLEIQNARSIIEELLHDFPLSGQPEKATCFALFISPFVRDLIQGQTPLHLIESPCPGTGKSLLARVLTYPALGHDIEFGTVPRDEDEFRKRITSALISNPSFVLFDNVSKLRSSQLSAAITSPVWEDRILGGPEMARLPVKCIWIATGNNPDLSEEIARRTIRIRIDAKVDRPWQRDSSQFRHPNIISWVKQNRGELIWAALTLTKAWIAAGCPEPKGITPFGSFEEYSRVIGGILQVAGVKGFLGNADEFYETSDSEGADLRFFVSKWWERFEGKPVGVSEIYKLIIEADLPIDLGNGKGERSQKTCLGKILSSLRDRQIGECRVVHAGSKNGAKLWKLIGQEVTSGNEHHEHRDDVHKDVHSSKLLEEHHKMNINEHTEHYLVEEKIDQDDISNLSDIIQYTCDLSKKNDIVLAKNVQDVHDVHLHVKEQQLTMPEHLDSQTTCSVDVHCESPTHPNEIPSHLSSITKTTNPSFTDPFFQPKKTVNTSTPTPFICREGCKHYDGVKDATDGIFKEFCCHGRSYLIEETRSCDHFEDKNPVYDEEDGILRF